MKERKYVDPEKAFVVHPDIADQFTTYDGNPDHFKEVFRKRDKLVEEGEVYWNTEHDVEMAETARERSQQPGWRFPGRKPKTSH